MNSFVEYLSHLNYVTEMSFGTNTGSEFFLSELINYTVDISPLCSFIVVRIHLSGESPEAAVANSSASLPPEAIFYFCFKSSKC